MATELNGPARMTTRPGARATRLLSAAAVALIVATLAISCLRVARAWPLESHLGYAEGIWVGLALDAAQGILYRPLDGPLGYGGTRYFPLFFSLHAAAIHAGLAPIMVGHILAAASVALLLVGLFVWLRRIGAARLPSLAVAAVVLASQPVQLALLTIRGDALPAAFSVLGLAASAAPRASGLAPVLFTLAFAAKPTSLYAPAGAVLTLLLAGRRREAVRLGALTAAGALLVLAAMSLASDHRVWTVLAMSASGGAGWSALVSAPLSLARILRRTPELILILQFAGAWVLTGGRRAFTLEVVTGIVCLAATTAIYASPATVENHLIDVAAIAVVGIGAVAARHKTLLNVVMAVLLICGAAGVAGAVGRLTEDRKDMRGPRLAALSALRDTRRPVFYQQPMLAAHLGEQSYILDPYLFSVRVSRDATVLNRLLDDFDRQFFGAVVLEHSSPALALADLPQDAADRFLAALDRNYELESVVEGRPIYRPRGR